MCEMNGLMVIWKEMSGGLGDKIDWQPLPTQ